MRFINIFVVSAIFMQLSFSSEPEKQFMTDKQVEFAQRALKAVCNIGIGYNVLKKLNAPEQYIEQVNPLNIFGGEPDQVEINGYYNRSDKRRNNTITLRDKILAGMTFKNPYDKSEKTIDLLNVVAEGRKVIDLMQPRNNSKKWRTHKEEMFVELDTTMNGVLVFAACKYIQLLSQRYGKIHVYIKHSPTLSNINSMDKINYMLHSFNLDNCFESIPIKFPKTNVGLCEWLLGAILKGQPEPKVIDRKVYQLFYSGGETYECVKPTKPKYDANHGETSFAECQNEKNWQLITDKIEDAEERSIYSNTNKRILKDIDGGNLISYRPKADSEKPAKTKPMKIFTPTAAQYQLDVLETDDYSKALEEALYSLIYDISFLIEDAANKKFKNSLS